MQQEVTGNLGELLLQDQLSLPTQPKSLGLKNSHQLFGQPLTDDLEGVNSLSSEQRERSLDVDGPEAPPIEDVAVFGSAVSQGESSSFVQINGQSGSASFEFFHASDPHHDADHDHYDTEHDHHELDPHENGLIQVGYHAVHYSPDDAALDHDHHAHHLEAHHEEEEVGFELFSAPESWTRTATNGGGISQGESVTLTWSLAAEGTFIPGFAGELDADSNLQAFLNSAYDNGNGINDERDIWFPIIQSAFDRWSELGGAKFVYEPADDGAEFSNFTHINRGVLGTRGDIRLGGHAIDGRYNTLGYNFSSDVGEMILDTDDSAFADNVNQPVWLRNLIAHELGHALGLSHISSDDASFLLEPSISTAFDGPQLDDILGLHRLYGDALESANGLPNESNDSIVSATNLGVISPGNKVAVGSDATDGATEVTGSQTDFVSIDDDSDIDVYRFGIKTPAAVDFVLHPRGATYAQDGTALNTKAYSDLSLSILDRNGAVLASANRNSAGGSEQILGYQFDAAGEYFVQVTGADNNVQLYELELLLSGLSLTGGSSADLLAGGDGDDTLLGNSGSDRLYGEEGDDSLNGGASNDTLRGGSGADTLNGGSGTDVVDYYGSASVSVNLATSVVSGGDAQGDRLIGLERVYGSNEGDQITGTNGSNLLWGRSGDDTIKGGSGNDILRGGIGADLLNGESGTDTVDYLGSVLGVTVNLLTGVHRNGDAEGDILMDFERVYGSNEGDHLTGNTFSNLIWGRDGNDTINGGSGNDIIRSGLGADILNGDSGLDAADYLTSPVSVTVNLLTGVNQGGDAQGDQLTNFERVYGSDFDDQISGDSLANSLWGRDGDDTIHGAAGNDTIRSGPGRDSLDGGDGLDTLDYVASNSAVTVDLEAEILQGGDATGDIAINFERVYGSNFNDQISGDALGNLLLGRSGRDTLFGAEGNDILRGGSGADSLNGGLGADILDYFGSTAGVTVNLSTGIVNGGDAQGDTIANFERAYGSNVDDQLTGDASGNLLFGRSGRDTLMGGLGRDTLLGGNGSDQFLIAHLNESLLSSSDWIKDFDIGVDSLNALTAVSSSHLPQLGRVATLNSAGIQAVLTETDFMAQGAATFTFEDRTYIALNDGVAGFQSSQDSIINITGYSGNLTNLSVV